jgi:hypothetical protein
LATARNIIVPIIANTNPLNRGRIATAGDATLACGHVDGSGRTRPTESIDEAEPCGTDTASIGKKDLIFGTLDALGTIDHPTGRGTGSGRDAGGTVETRT